ncbi:IclR family transcriptional regulator [Halalkalibacter krulwichiae]|nr:IclR family transcriptional regulator [Halalkalibacter krulwichiae]
MSVINVLRVHPDKSLSISELAKQCELPLSTMHRLLSSLLEHGLIQQEEETKKYHLGYLWLELGLQMYDTIDYVSKIRPELEALMQKVEENVYLSKPMQTDSLIIERIDSLSNNIRVYDQIGLRIPLHIGASNKVMVAHFPEEKATEIIHELVPEEEQAAFREQLTEIKQQGYAVSHGERTEGTSSVAAPIFNHFGEIHGAVSIGFVNYHLTDRRLDELLSAIIESGRKISLLLGYKG